MSCPFVKMVNNIENTELNYLRTIICPRKCELLVERISIGNVIEKLVEHSIHCIYLLPRQLEFVLMSQ